jgi:tRNA-dihydrouridine synthase
MVGRGAYGAPWLPARIAQALERGIDPGAPSLARQKQIAIGHIGAMIEAGGPVGLKAARKHVGWYLASSGRPDAAVRVWRQRLCTEEAAHAVLAGLADFYDEGLGADPAERVAA